MELAAPISFLDSINANVHLDSEDGSAERWRFFEQRDADAITAQDTYSLESAILGFVDNVAALVAMRDMTEVRVQGLTPVHYRIVAYRQSRPELLVMISVARHLDPETVSRNHFTVSLCGARDVVRAVHEALHAGCGGGRLATINWWFREGDRSQYRCVTMEPPPPLHDAYYPFIPEGIDAYIEAYLAHSAPILLMAGPIGTGKTSLLRHMIFKWRLDATITYDEAVIACDTMFLDFLTRRDPGILVIEDSDALLTSREHAGNKMMARFLGISDGLIRMADKKIVFTTNIGDFSNIDEALVRPGRCYDSLLFRRLTAHEADAAAAAAGLPLPLLRRGEELSLAALFNPGHRRAPGRKVGF